MASEWLVALRSASAHGFELCETLSTLQPVQHPLLLRGPPMHALFAVFLASVVVVCTANALQCNASYTWYKWVSWLVQVLSIAWLILFRHQTQTGRILGALASLSFYQPHSQSQLV